MSYAITEIDGAPAEDGEVPVKARLVDEHGNVLLTLDNRILSNKLDALIKEIRTTNIILSEMMDKDIEDWK